MFVCFLQISQHPRTRPSKFSALSRFQCARRAFSESSVWFKSAWKISLASPVQPRVTLATTGGGHFMQIPRCALPAVAPPLGPGASARFLEASAKNGVRKIASPGPRSSYVALLHLQVGVGPGVCVGGRCSFRLHLGASQASGEFADRNPFISFANHMSCSILVG